MNKAEIVKQVKALLNMEVEVEVKPVAEIDKEVKMAEAVLKNGVKIMTPDDEFKVGSDVLVVAEDGSETPAPDAEHELEDGTIVVTVEGKITEIKEVEVEEPEVEAEEDLGKKEVSMEAFKKLQEKVLELEKTLEKRNDSFKKVQEATLFLADEFSKLPGGEKIQVEKTGLKAEERKGGFSKEEKFLKLLKSIRQN